MLPASSCPTSRCDMVSPSAQERAWSCPTQQGAHNKPKYHFLLFLLTLSELQWPDLHSSLENMQFKSDITKLWSFKSVFSHTPLLKSQTQVTRGKKAHSNIYHRARQVTAGMMLDSNYPFPVYNLPDIFTIVFSCFFKTFFLYPCPCPNMPHNHRS